MNRSFPMAGFCSLSIQDLENCLAAGGQVATEEFECGCREEPKLSTIALGDFCTANLASLMHDF
jgi:hypothetical protein